MARSISSSASRIGLLGLCLMLTPSLISVSAELTDNELAAVVTLILGKPDLDSDSDGDGISDIEDAFPDNPKENKDSDGDGVGDNSDVFPLDPNKSNAVVVNFNTAGVSSIALNTDAVSLGSNGSRRARDGGESSDNNNIIAYDEDGNEVEEGIKTSEVLFVAEAVLAPDGAFLFLFTSPHIQRALTLPQEVCSLYRINLETEAVDCLVSAMGDIQPKILNTMAIYSANRKGIDLRADGQAVLFGLNYDRALPEGINGGTQSGYAWLLSPTGELTGIEPTENFFIYDALWFDDTRVALLEVEYMELGNKRQWRIINADSLTNATAPIPVSGFSTASRGPAGLMLPGGIIKRDSLSFESRGEGSYECKVIEDSYSNFFAWSCLDLKQVTGDGSAYTELEIPTGESNASPSWDKQSGLGTDIKYAQVSSDPAFLAFTKGFAPRTPIVSIEGQTFQNGEELSISYLDGAVTVVFGLSSSDEWWGVQATQEISEDIVVSYETRIDAESTDTRTIRIPFSAVNAWLAATEKPRCRAATGDCLNWANPEPAEEGFCLHKYGTDPASDRCIQFNQADNPRLAYRVLRNDMESARWQRFDDEEVYPNQGGNAYPGVQTVALIDGRLQAYFKDSRDHKYYLAVADAANFWANGDSALLFASAQNSSGDNVIITEATSLTLPPALPLAGVTVSATVEEDTVVVGITLPDITDALSYEFNTFAATPSVRVTALNNPAAISPTAPASVVAPNRLEIEYLATDFTSGQIYVAELPDDFLVNGSVRKRAPGADLLFAAP